MIYQEEIVNPITIGGYHTPTPQHIEEEDIVSTLRNKRVQRNKNFVRIHIL